MAPRIIQQLGSVCGKAVKRIINESDTQKLSYPLKQSGFLTQLSNMSTVVVSEHLITKYRISNLHIVQHSSKWVFVTSLIQFTSTYSVSVAKINNTTDEFCSFYVTTQLNYHQRYYIINVYKYHHVTLWDYWWLLLMADVRLHNHQYNW